MYNSSNNPFANSQTLWIGDLDPYMDEEFVRRLFGPDVQPYLSAVKLIKKDGRPAGYGFLDFTTRDAAQQVLNNYSGKPILHAPGKVYRLNWASGHITGGTGQAAKQLAGNIGGDLYSIFVGDLGPEVTDYILMTAFQQRYPSVRGAKVIIDSSTGHSKGFGFVKFADENEMLRAMEQMNGQYVGSRPIKVATASKKGIATPGSIGSQTGYLQSISPTPMNKYDSEAANTTIYVGNIDQNTDENTLRQAFSIYGPIILVKIPSNNRHCGFVQFAERSQAERAILEMNGTRINNNIVRVSWGKQQKKPAQQQQQQAMRVSGYTSVSPSPMTSPGTAIIQQPSAQLLQQQQQQYMAYLAWQQQMMAYTHMQQQMAQQHAISQPKPSTNDDILPADYFTRKFDVEKENTRYINSEAPIFIFNSILLDQNE